MSGSFRMTRRKNDIKKKLHDASENHWLGEGTAGQEMLLLELDPVLFAVDQALATLSSSIAYHYQPVDYQKPFAVLACPDAALAWQLGYLTKHFNTYLLAENVDEVTDQAADRFNAKLVAGIEEVEHEITFYLNTNTSWSSRLALVNEVRAARTLLAPSGSACFILRAVEDRGDSVIQWSEGIADRLQDIENGDVFSLPKPDEVSRHTLNDSPPEDLLPSFTKRNREFFGRNMRELFLQRMQESDFGDCFRKSAQSKIAAALLLWRANGVVPHPEA